MKIWREYSPRYKRKVWLFRFEFARRNYRRGGFDSKEMAQAAADALRAQLQLQRYGLAPPPEDNRPRVTLAEVLDERWRRTTDRRTKFYRERVFETFQKLLPAGVLVAQVTTASFAAYLDHRRKTVAIQTAQRELTEIIAALNAAPDFFPSLADYQAPHRPRVKTPSGARERIITPTESDAILRELRRPQEPDELSHHYAARLDAADLFELALHTAARRGELLRLRWSDVNFDWHTLRVDSTKTDSVRVVPLTDRALELLRARRAREGGTFVFDARQGRGAAKSDFHEATLADACARAGVPYGRKTPGGLTLHDARHTAITAMLQGGASIETVKSISGHSTTGMLMRYAHATETSQRAAVEKLNDILTAGPPKVPKVPVVPKRARAGK